MSSPCLFLLTPGITAPRILAILHFFQLAVTKHRQNPFQEREYQGADQDAVYNRWYQDKRYMGAYKATKTLQGIVIDVSMVGFNIDNITAKNDSEFAGT